MAQATAPILDFTFMIRSRASGRLMGIFGSVIEALVLAMLDPWGMISRLAAV